MIRARCTGCGRWVWFWQRRGWIVGDGQILWWHGKCWNPDR
jgi:hypothetical protein